MKTLTKTLLFATAITASIGVFAHLGGGNSDHQFMHGMMDTDSPQYQSMLELRKDPEAMRAWMQSMHDNPEAMQEWMEQVHGEDFANMGVRGRGGCHGTRNNAEATTE